MQNPDTSKVGRIFSAQPVLTAFLIYYFFFLLVFFQFPINGSLAGNTDTVGCLGLMRDTGNRLINFFTGEQKGHAYYPETGLQPYAEPYLGQTALFLFFKLFGFNDLWTYYLFISCLYALNGFGMFLLARYLTNNYFAALISGFLFSASSYAFSNMELYNGISFFFTLLCIYFFLRFLDSGETRALIAAYALGSMQVYWSGYIFAFQTLLLGIILLIRLKQTFTEKRISSLILYSPMAFILLAPYLYFYIFNSRLLGAYNPLSENPQWLEFYSLSLKDFIRSSPNNLIYPAIMDTNEGKAIRNLYHANIGVVIYALALIGFFGKKKYTVVWLISFIIGLIISLGPVLSVAGTRIEMPMKFVYENTALASLFRIPGRAFSLCTIALAMMAAIGITSLMDALGKYKLAVLIVLPLFLLENLPSRFHHYRSAFILNAPDKFIDFFKKIKETKRVAHLPSSLFSEHSTYHNEISEFSREYIYAYWQTFHGHSIINGSSGYFPLSRMENNALIKTFMVNNKALENLITKNDLNYIVYHTDMAFTEEEKHLKGFLINSAHLTTVMETDRFIIFKTMIE